MGAGHVPPTGGEFKAPPYGWGFLLKKLAPYGGSAIRWFIAEVGGFGSLVLQLRTMMHKTHSIIVGRGGAVLTQHLSNCFHFRLVAPLGHRIQSIQQRLKIPFEEARTLVLENQKAREKFIESFLNRSIADPYYYHCVFDSSKSKIPSIARSILDLMFES